MKRELQQAIPSPSPPNKTKNNNSELKPDFKIKKMRLTNLVLYMLKSFRPYLLVVILSLLFTTVFVDQALCQPPPPPPGGATGTGGHNLTANQGAPLEKVFGYF